ncbi:hypothetical protein HWV62_29294 [Athelia sp. TMB]|nr:hypothetical protein HWV62_29294 [Athelia sp. TMB]
MELEECRQNNTTQARGRSSSPRRQQSRALSPRQRSPYQHKGDRRHSSSPGRSPTYPRSSPSRSLSRTPPRYATPGSRSSSATRVTDEHLEQTTTVSEPKISTPSSEPAMLHTAPQLPLLTRITPRDRDTPRDSTPSDGRGLNRNRHIGLNKPRNLSNRFLHGRWAEFIVSTLADCDVLYNAAEYDGKALLYLDYCNAIYQRPEATKTEGMRALIARWNSFIRIHRGRRDELRGIHAVPVKIASSRTRRRANRSQSPTTPGSSTLDSPASLELAALQLTDSPPQYDALVPPVVTAQSSAPSDTPVSSPPPFAACDVTILGPSLSDYPWALSSPEHWPFGIRALVNGSPTEVTDEIHGTNHAPYEGDVRGWGWLEGLAPAHDGVDDTRYEQFMRVAVNNLAIPIEFNTALDGLESFTDLPIEHFPFDTATITPDTIAQWLHEHGVSRSSDDMVAIHGYARQAAPRHRIVAPPPYVAPPTPDERLDYGDISE